MKGGHLASIPPQVGVSAPFQKVPHNVRVGHGIDGPVQWAIALEKVVLVCKWLGTCFTVCREVRIAGNHGICVLKPVLFQRGHQTLFCLSPFRHSLMHTTILKNTRLIISSLGINVYTTYEADHADHIDHTSFSLITYG
jgi:hypothetical protein